MFIFPRAITHPLAFEIPFSDTLTKQSL